MRFLQNILPHWSALGTEPSALGQCYTPWCTVGNEHWWNGATIRGLLRSAMRRAKDLMALLRARRSATQNPDPRTDRRRNPIYTPIDRRSLASREMNCPDTARVSQNFRGLTSYFFFVPTARPPGGDEPIESVVADRGTFCRDKPRSRALSPH
jgi:hypothetical protein